MKSLVWFLAMIPVATLAGCNGNDVPWPLVGTLERDRLELIAEAQEPIATIDVAEGETVEAGQVLLRLNPSLYQAQLDQTLAARERAAQRVAELERGAREERIAEARAGLEGARKHLIAQQREYDRVKQLVDRKLQSPSELDRIFDLREVAAAQRDEAQARLSELLTGTTVEELAQARASMAEADAAVRVAQIALERLTVVAPRAGIVESLPYRFGERPPRGATVAIMLAAGQPYARIFVPEPWRARIATGQQARVRADGVAGDMAGRVRFVGSDAVFTPYFALTQRDRSRLAYLAEVTLTGDAALGLPSGLPVEVDFPGLQ